MIKQPRYLVKFTNAYNDNGTVWYSITVFNSKQDQSWSFKERYSRMRVIHENCEKTKWRNDLPEFPPRKYFGNVKEEFIQKRKKELENYYSTLFRTVPIQEFPELLAFFNTNKPVKEKLLPGKRPQQVDNPPPKPEKKQKQLKRVFEDIVAKAEQEMVESNDFDREIQDETRRKFNQQFQKLKLELRSPLLQGVVLPKGEKENDAEYWSMFFQDQHENRISKLSKVCNQVVDVLRQEIKCNTNFVIAL